MKTACLTPAVADTRPYLSSTSIEAGRATNRVRSNANPDSCNAIRLLVFTSLYPNRMQPRHGVFVEERLRHLVASGKIAATVVAPVPWFPFRNSRYGRYSAYAQIPESEERYGLQILHPRYPVLPKVGMSVAPYLMYRTLLPVMQKLIGQDPRYDLIDAHYFYPDGVAAVALGRQLGKPVVVTARGNDVTLIPHHRIPRWQIQHAAAGATALVTVSSALRERLIELGVAGGRVTVLRNGVDLERFRILDVSSQRQGLGLRGPVWLAVGHLIERKGVHLVIESLPLVPTATLLIVGDGPEERNLRNLTHRLGVSERVRFLGAKHHTELREYYNLADATILASSREGMPNVVLESLACGTAVIAAPFDGVTELLDAPEAGEIAERRSADALARAWQRWWDRRSTRRDTRQFAERFSWTPVVEAQVALYTQVLRVGAEGARTEARHV